MRGKKVPIRISPNTALLKMLTSITLTWLILGALLFGGAGKVDWPLGWIFFSIWGFLKLIFILLIRWIDPELMIERTTHHENTKSYERIILPLYFVMSFGTILVASIDSGRFHWSGQMPISVIMISYLIYFLGNGLATWAAISNPFFSSESRLQKDRNQKVIKMGPYKFVRHPAYSSSIILWPITGLLLGSWWAVLPGIMAALMMVMRTIFEDQMLLTELDRYAQYSEEVPDKLIPGVW